MKKLLTAFVCLAFLSCGKSTSVETPIVQAHILHLEQVDANTMFSEFVGDVPYTVLDEDYINKETLIRLYDNRLLRYHGVTLKDARVNLNNGRISEMEISFFANPIDKDKEEENDKEGNEEGKKINYNIDATKVKEMLTQQLGEPEEHTYKEYTFFWKTNNNEYSISISDDSYNNCELKIEFNKEDEARHYFD